MRLRRIFSGFSRSRGVIFLVGALLLGLGLAKTPPLYARHTSAESTAVPSAGGAASPNHSALLGLVEEIAQQVSAMRGLSYQRPFQRGVLSRAEIVQKLRERLAKEFSKEEIRVESGMLKRLGLLPEDADYEQTLLDMLAEQVAGFYDPYARTLYIADWLPAEMQRPALAHEIEHALQDQHFDLQKFSAPIKEDGDRQLARSAVVEGDGTAVMLEYARRGLSHENLRLPEDLGHLGKQMMQLSMSATPAFQKAPAALRETLVFPYAAGLEFVLARRQGSHSGVGAAEGASWSRVDDLFRDPPDSTEQILHPEKYEPRERPVRITAAPLSSLAPRHEVRRDVMGELVWKLWFDQQLPESQAMEAAAGWGGDRLVAYETSGDSLPALVILSAWDTDLDADEAEAAMRKVLSGLAGQKESSPGTKHALTPPLRDARGVTLPLRDAKGIASHSGAVERSATPIPQDGFFREKGGLSFGLLRRGRLLLLLCGTPKGSERRIADEVFSTFKVEWPSPS
jgi:hypothetical protein